jgi:hypothetical protein
VQARQAELTVLPFVHPIGAALRPFVASSTVRKGTTKRSFCTIAMGLAFGAWRFRRSTRVSARTVRTKNLRLEANHVAA